MVPVASDDDMDSALVPQIVPHLSSSNASAVHPEPNKSYCTPQKIHRGEEATTTNTTPALPTYADLQASADRAIVNQLAETSLNDRHALQVNSAERSGPQKVSET